MNNPYSNCNPLSNEGVRVKSGTRSNNVIPKNKKLKNKKAARKLVLLSRKKNRKG